MRVDEGEEMFMQKKDSQGENKNKSPQNQRIATESKIIEKLISSSVKVISNQ